MCCSFSRGTGSLGSNSFVEVPLTDAWQNLRNGVIKQLFQISIKYDKNVSSIKQLGLRHINIQEYLFKIIEPWKCGRTLQLYTIKIESSYVARRFILKKPKWSNLRLWNFNINLYLSVHVDKRGINYIYYFSSGQSIFSFHYWIISFLYLLIYTFIINVY